MQCIPVSDLKKSKLQTNGTPYIAMSNIQNFHDKLQEYDLYFHPLPKFKSNDHRP